MQNPGKRRLKIGYLWQSASADLTQNSATTLHIKAVIEGLERRGHSVTLVTFEQGAIQSTSDRLNWQPADLGLNQHRAFRLFERGVRGVQSRLRLPYLNLFDSFRFSEACISALADCDLLYERYWPLNYGGVITARRLGIPLVLEINGELSEDYAHLGLQLSRLQWATLGLMVRLMFRQVAHSVAVGERIKTQMAERWRIDPTRVSVIVNGTEYDLFAESRCAAQVRQAYQLPAGPLIGFVGGFKPWHGVEVLIRAFQQLHRHHPETGLVLIGDGPEREEMKHLVDSLGLNRAVRFLGRREIHEVAEILAAVDIATAPYCNRQETIGMKLFDYMAAGKAIVVSGQNQQNSVLEHLHTGWVVEPGDVHTLAEALCTLVEDPSLRARLGENAQHQAKAHHTWDQTVAKIEQLCFGILATRQLYSFTGA